MRYLQAIRAARDNPQQIEELYRAAQAGDAAAEFRADMLACYQESPQDVLYAAWYWRLQSPAQEQAERHPPHWKLAIPLSLLTGLALWLLANEGLAFAGSGSMPYVMLLWSPVVGIVVLAYLTFTARAGYQRAAQAGAGLIAATAYAMLLAAGHPAYRDLMLLHLPLLAFAGVGAGVVGLGASATDFFAFLARAIEVVVIGGVYLIAVFIFVGISLAMFDALGLSIRARGAQSPFLGAAGLIPVIAVASLYDPRVGPAEQEFGRGLSRMVALLPRLLLPLTLVVLVVYLLVIPFNFMAPFEKREVLVVYNGMLFAVMALLIGATPLRDDDLSPRYRRALRGAIRAVAILVVLVSLYALSATVYRTVQGGLTINRVTIIGWNIINTALLALLSIRQFRGGEAGWVAALHATFRVGGIAYIAWAGILLLAMPWVF